MKHAAKRCWSPDFQRHFHCVPKENKTIRSRKKSNVWVLPFMTLYFIMHERSLRPHILSNMYYLIVHQNAWRQCRIAEYTTFFRWFYWPQFETPKSFFIRASIPRWTPSFGTVVWRRTWSSSRTVERQMQRRGGVDPPSSQKRVLFLCLFSHVKKKKKHVFCYVFRHVVSCVLLCCFAAFYSFLEGYLKGLGIAMTVIL